jgi:DNA polymerase phi
MMDPYMKFKYKRYQPLERLMFMSKKRKRDATDVDLDLVETYEQLANEDEAIRLAAAHKLLTEVYRPDTTTAEQLDSVLTRLFRGLCSGRKAARLGFAVALTELLTELSKAKTPSATITQEEVITLFESSSTVKGGTSGQDERDHYFGRVFGAEAIIKSGFLFNWPDPFQWTRLLSSLCSLAQKKPWLRQECGWVLYQLASQPFDSAKQPFVEEALKTMASTNIIRTPEGVAVWLAAKQQYPDANLSEHVWKHKHPLAKKGVQSLAEIMKDAKPQQSDDKHEVQGAAVWSATLHFAWKVVLAFLYKNNGHQNLDFSAFWKGVVEEGLFSGKSSTERKSSGLLLWATILESAPVPLLPSTFTKNALHCLITSLAGEEQYLRKGAQQLLKILKRQASLRIPAEDERVVGACLSNLLDVTNYADFDRLTKTTAVAELVTLSDWGTQRATFESLNAQCVTVMREEAVENRDSKIRYVLDLQSKMYMADLKAYMSPPVDNADARCYWILQCWLEYMSQLKNSAEDVRSFLHDRIATAFDQLLRHGTRGIELIGRVLSKKEWRKPIEQDFDETIKKILRFAFEKLDCFFDAGGQAEYPAGPENASKDVVSQADGMVVLYGILIFETYSGNTDAAEVLLELNQGTQDGYFPTEVLIEALLSLASQPSRLARTAVATVFGTMISESFGLGIEGVKSLTRVLLTKENSQGQQEIFEAANDENLKDVQEDGHSNEEGSLDSDVEMINGVDQPSEGLEETSPDTSDNDSVFDEEEADNNAEAYAALDAALASALGNSKSNPEESASDSDPDLSDSEMLALDAQLSTVFREHASVLSQRKEQKKTQKQTKEALINFKNRALDLVEIYLKRQPLNPLCLEFMLPLLQAIEVTKTKQYAERCCGFMREYNAKCKGQNVPLLSDTKDATALATLSSMLAQIHELATKPTSNAHAAACSQASLLITKVLVKSCGKEGLDVSVDRYAKTQMRWLVEQGKGVQLKPKLFTDWNNWCASVAGSVLKATEDVPEMNLEVNKSALKKNGKEKKVAEGKVLNVLEAEEEQADKVVEESKSSKKSRKKEKKKERERQESNKERKQRREERTVRKEEEARKEREDELAEVPKEKELPHWAAREGRERQRKLQKQRLEKEQKREKKQKK